MTTLPWWFDLLSATSDDSSDDEWLPPSPRDTLVRQRAVANDTPETETESDTESEASIDIEHTDDETESDPEPTTSDEEFIVLDDTP
eukprot:COSAG06_NODE_327_length_17446_cov_7.157491_4_plen_87_part_00